MAVKLVVNISNKALYTIIALFVFGVVGLFVYAYSNVPNPGHGADQVVVNIGGQEMTLQQAIDEGVLDGGGGSSGIDFYWALEEVGCAPGYQDTLIRDDDDQYHDLNENGFRTGSKRLILCSKGVETTWAAQCPQGYVDSGLTDDSDNDHKLWETGGGKTDLHFCISGISEVEWTGGCRTGFIPVPIFDESDDYHSICEGESSEGIGSLQLCVK